MSSIIWLARHGNRLDFVNPEWFNTAVRKYDPPLSEDGVIQARELGDRLQKEKITQIFASPFLRTIQTANEVAKILNLPIKLEAGLGEWHNPHWMTATPETHPQEFLASEYSRIDWNYKSLVTPQYPESEEEVNCRTAITVQKLVAEFQEEILIVGHGASVWGGTRGLIPDCPPFKVSLCCLVKIVPNSQSWKLELAGDTSHLTNSETQIRFN
jgi:broad specificity phosphatase PhoE